MTTPGTRDGLWVEALQAGYGKSRVLHGVNLQVAAGEIVGLLGRNGAGRSTLLKAIMGLVPAQGLMRYRSTSLLGLPTHVIARRGLGYVPESRDVFASLTVEQNLLLGLKPEGAGRWHPADIYTLFPALAGRRQVQAGVLSGGEQQMLSLGRTLMGDPSMILIDEPTEGLAPQVVQQVAAFLKRLRAAGVGVLLVEQKLSMALEVSDRVYVMGHGRIVFEGEPERLRGDAPTRREWLGV